MIEQDGLALELQDIGYIDHLEARSQLRPVESLPAKEVANERYISERDMVLLGLEGMSEQEYQQELYRREWCAGLVQEEMQAHVDGRLGQAPASEEFIRRVITRRTHDLSEIYGVEQVEPEDEVAKKNALKATVRVISQLNLKYANAILGLELDTPLEDTQRTILSRTSGGLFTQQDIETIFKEFSIPPLTKYPN